MAWYDYLNPANWRLKWPPYQAPPVFQVTVVETDKGSVGVLHQISGSKSGGLEKKVNENVVPSKDIPGQLYGTAYKSKQDENKIITPVGNKIGGATGSVVPSKGDEVKLIYHMRYFDSSKASQDPVDVILADCPISRYSGRRVRISLQDLREIAFLPTDVAKMADPFPYQGDKFEALYESKLKNSKGKKS